MATQQQSAEVYTGLQAQAAERAHAPEQVPPPDDDLPFDNAAGLTVLAAGVLVVLAKAFALLLGGGLVVVGVLQATSTHNPGWLISVAAGLWLLYLVWRARK